MLNLKSVINRIMAPPVFADDEKTRIARHLYRILWGAITVMTLVEIALIIILPENIARSLMNIMVVDGSCIVYLGLTRYGYTRLTSIFFVLETWVLATVMAFTAGGMHAPYGVVYIAIIFVVGLLLGERAGIGAGVVCCLTGLMFIWAERSGHLPVSVIQHTAISLWVVYAFFMAAIIALQYVSTLSIKDSLKQARHELAARKQAEESLRKSEEKYSKAFKASPESISIASTEDGRYIEVNDIFLKQTGFSRDEVINHTSKELNVWVDMDDRQRFLKELSTKGFLRNFETRYRMRNGEIRDYSVSSEIIEIEGKQCSLNFILDITERKQAEEALKESEEMLRRAQNIAQIGHFKFNPFTGIVEGSVELFRIFGLTMENYQFSDFVALVHPDDRSLDVATITSAIERETNYTIEHRLLLRDGTLRWVRAVGEFVSVLPKEQSVLIGTVQDITMQKLAEEILRTSEERFRRMFQYSAAGMVVVSPDSYFLQANDAFCNMLGYTEAELLEKTFQDVTMPEDRAVGGELVRQVLSGGKESFQFEKRYLCKDGTVIWGLVCSTLIRDNLNKPLHFVTQIQDISSRKESEGALRESEARFRSIVERNKDGFIYFDGITQKSIFGNKAMAELLGCSVEELAGRSIESLHPPEEWVNLEQEFQKHIKGEISFSAGVPVLRNDGSVFYVDISSGLTLIKERSYFFGFFHDITERKLAEQNILEAEERYRTVIEQSNDGVSYVKNGIHIFVNRKFLEMFGYDDLDELVGKTTDLVVHPDYFGEAEDFRQRRQRGEPVPARFEFKGIRKDSRIILVDASVTRTIYRGEIVAFIVSRDITDRRKAEEALRESEQRYRAVIEHSNDAIALVKEGKHSYVNQRFLEIFGYEKPEEVVGNTPLQIIHPDERERIIAYNNLRESGKEVPNRLEFKGIRKDGTAIFLENSITTMVDQGVSTTIAFLKDITEYKQAESQREATVEALQESEKRYRSLVENANEAIYVAQDNMVKFVNRAGVEMSGYSEEEIMSKPFIEFVHPDDRATAGERYLKRLRGEEIERRYTFRFITKNNGIKWLELGAVVISFAGRPATLNIVTDITERRKSEEALRESELRFKTQYHGSPIPTATWQKQGKDFVLVDVNDAAERVANHAVTQIVGKTAHELYRDRQDILDNLQQCFSEKGTIVKEIRSRHFMPGKLVIATYAFVPPDLVMVHMEDVTERKETEAALRAAKDFAEKLIQTANTMVVGLDTMGNITVFNQAAEEIMGYTKDELMGRNWFEVIVPRARYPEVWNIFEQQMTAGKVPMRFENPILTKSGNERYIVWRNNTIYEKGHVAGSISFGMDITDRMRTEEALRKSEATLRSIFAASPVGMSLLTIDRKIVWLNDKMTSVIGYTIEDIRRREAWGIYPTKEEAARVGEIVYGEVLRGGIGITDTKWVHKDGRVLDMHVSAAAVDPDDLSAGIVFVAMDITEQKNMEDTIKTSLREKEILLREIHHRVKNNLQVILSLLTLQSHYISDDKALDILKGSVNRIRTMSHIHEKLYQSKDQARINFGVYIKELAEQLYSSYGLDTKSISLKTHIADLSFNINTAIPLGLLINELISNALKHAFPDKGKGKMTISLSEEEDRLVLLVSDNGVGFPPHIDYRKTESLGMQLVIELVEQLGGTIELRQGHGTTFVITFKREA